MSQAENRGKVDSSGVENRTSENSETGSSGDSKDGSSIDSTQNLHTKNLSKKDSKQTKSAHLSKSRIIPSRYKQAASEISMKAATNSPNLSNSGSSFEKFKANSRTKRTLNLKQGTASSMTNLTQVGTTLSTKTPLRINVLKPKTKCSRNSNPKLHSTALHSTTFLDKTQLGCSEDFSTTVVGGHKCFRPNLESNALESLSELPDISEICPTTPKENQKAENTVISAPTEKVEEVFEEEDQKDFTVEEINAEYLRYLTWSFVDVRSKEAFQNQVKEARKQISFLTQLIEEEEDKACEEKQKLQLLDHYEKVCQNHTVLKEEISKLNESIPSCKNSLENLAHHLEAQMNHIRLENIYIPEDKASYKDDLQEALRENCHILNLLNSNLQPQTNRLQSISNLINALDEEADAIEHCLEQGEKAASLAIQETSLKLTLNTLNKEVSASCNT